MNPPTRRTVMKSIALVGASGRLGSFILTALLENGFDVTILARDGSTSIASFPHHPKQKIITVNFSDVDSLITALEGIDGVVSNVASAAIRSQKPLIDASVTAGVKRFLPSDFGMDMEVEANRLVPFYQPKIEIASHLQQKADAHPDFSYTFVCIGLFLEWGLETGVLANLQDHTATLWDGGETQVSTTSRRSVAKAVVGVLKNAEATRNKKVRVHDTTITQKQIIAIAKEADGKEWTVKQGHTAEAYQIGLDEMKKSSPDVRVAVFNQLYRTLFSAQHHPCFNDQLDNDLVDLPLMTSRQLEVVVRSCISNISS